jgi:hypothetical protein
MMESKQQPQQRKPSTGDNAYLKESELEPVSIYDTLLLNEHVWNVKDIGKNAISVGSKS